MPLILRETNKNRMSLLVTVCWQDTESGNKYCLIFTLKTSNTLAWRHNVMIMEVNCYRTCYKKEQKMFYVQ